MKKRFFLPSVLDPRPLTKTYTHRRWQLFGVKKPMVIFIIPSKLNSAFGTIGKATGVKMTAEAVGKNLSSHFSVNNLSLFAHVVMQ